MLLQSSILLSLQVIPAIASGVSTGRRGYGLIGYGIDMYKPYCAQACRDVFAAATLNCTIPPPEDHSEHEGMAGMMSHGDATTEPECYASDDIYLQSVAYCVSDKCKDINWQAWNYEKWWDNNVVGRAQSQPQPKITYVQALSKVTAKPSETFVSGSLNKTSLVGDEDWLSNVNAMAQFEDGEVVQEKYALVILLSGVIIPIGFSLLRFFPFPAVLRTKFRSYILDPPLFGRKHSQPSFFGMELMPTRGQALFLFYFTAINIVFCAVNFRVIEPNAWYPGDSWGQIVGPVSNRAGLLSFANFPLVFLYAGRNNPLLWVTNWSHSTFLLLHRWIACIASLQAIIHSIIWLHIHVKAGDHNEEAKLSYWVWGAVATIACSIMMPASVIPIRRKMYEAFLASHVVLAILTLVGCYLHIIDRFQYQWGYQTWMYVCMAVWAFDRIARFFRIVRNGVCTATVTPIDDDYYRVDVAGVSGNGHAYLYFPTLTWRVWENHPFSVASTVLPLGERKHHNHVSQDVEKDGVIVATDSSASSQRSARNVRVGLTFLIRGQTGITGLLRQRTSLPVLVEAPYKNHLPDFSAYNTMIVIAGGVGITAVVPILKAHFGRTKLYWGSRTHSLVDEMQETLVGVDKEVFIGKRMNIAEVLADELRGETGKAVVVVSGPFSMADDVRNEVCRLGRQEKVAVKLVEESFSW